MLALLLLVTRVRADHANYAIATDDFAVTANLLYRRLYSHVSSFRYSKRASALFRTEHATGGALSRWDVLHLERLNRREADQSTSLPSTPKYDVSILKFDPTAGPGALPSDLTLHLDGFLPSHITQREHVCQRLRALPLKLAFFSKLSY